MLSDERIPIFMEKLSSGAPVPGGGGGSALSGAQGAALLCMVCSLTIGKKKYAEYQDFALSTREKLIDITGSFIKLIDKDAEEFGGMSEVFGMPRETEDQKAERKRAMESALKACAIPPFAVMRLSLEALKIGEELFGKTYTGALSDIGVGALSLKASVQSAWLNVLININSVEDKAFADRFRSEGEAILKEALALADSIYERVEAGL